MIEWIGDMEYAILKINNHTIGNLTVYNDCDESYGWVFNWDFDIMKYDFEAQYFPVSETEMLWSECENIKRRVIYYAKDVIGRQHLKYKHIYESL